MEGEEAEHKILKQYHEEKAVSECYEIEIDRWEK